MAKRSSRFLSVLLCVCWTAGALAAQNPLGSQQRTQKISTLEGGFSGPLAALDFFGTSCATIGDLDGDGNDDLAVGSRDTAAGAGRESLWILFLNADGTVREHAEIPLPTGGPVGPPDQEDVSGTALAPLGDLDDDGVLDIAVGDPRSDDGGVARGAVWLLFLNADGTLKGRTSISSTKGGFGGALEDGDAFGFSLAALEPSAPEALVDLAIGAVGDDDGGPDRGAVWILSLEQGGTIVAERKISQQVGGFGGSLADGDAFGTSLADAGDVDHDGERDLAVGAEQDDEGGLDAGAVWLLFLDSAGAVQDEQKIAAASGAFPGLLEAQDNFGSGLATLGDLDGDGVLDLAVGAPGDDDGGANKGAAWFLFLEPDGTVGQVVKLSDADLGFAGRLSDGDFFGSSLCFLDDLDANGLPEIVAGAPGDDDGGDGFGAVYLSFFQFPATVVSNGSGVNPLALQQGANPPQIGTVWQGFIDESLLPSTLGGLTFNIIGASTRPLNDSVFLGSPIIVGELLIDLNELVLTQAVAPGESFAIPIINDVNLIGLESFTQGAAVRSGTIILTNRLDMVIGFPPSPPIKSPN